MKILVTGSNGFIGKRLVQELKKKRHFVKEFSRSNGKDILNQKHAENAMKGIDVVYHCAAELDEEAKLLFEINVTGTKNMLEAAAKERVKQFIHLSTVGVMGNFKGTADESTQYNQKTAYEKSKTEAEKLVLSYQEAIPITIIRPAFVFGNNRHWKSIISMISKNLPLPVNGKNIWQTIYLEDLINSLLIVLDNENAVGETFIVAEENPLTLKEFVEEIRKNLGMKKKIITVPGFIGKTGAFVMGTIAKLFGKKPLLSLEYLERLDRNRSYSVEKIKSIGWKQKYSTKAAIRETLEKMR
jgi:nucleoside-diphosphate-sugar epimerase